MKNCFKSFLLVGALLTVMSGCSDNDATPAPSDAEPTTPVIKAGEVFTHTVTRDGEVIEEVVVDVVNLGTEEEPALFQLRKSHKVNGAEVENGLHESNSFRSVNREGVMRFIVAFAKIFGIEVDPNSTDANEIEKRKQAFIDLANWLRANKVDLGLLMGLTQNDEEEVRAAVQMMDARNATVTRTAEANSCNGLLLALEDMGVTPLQFSQEVANQNTTLFDFFARVEEQGIDLPKLMAAGNTRGVTDIIKNVVEGIEILSKIIIKLIEAGKPVVDLNNTYISLLHQDDINPLNYSGGKRFFSPEYSVNYCTLAKAKVQFETYYGATHRTIPGLFIPRISMLVNEVRCSWGMHVNGQAEFAKADNVGTDQEPISESKCTVQLDYGDCCCFSYHAYLKFKVNAKDGFRETSWDNGK